MTEFVPTRSVGHRIVEIRGVKVILDSDLAPLYGVETKRLNEQMKRNRERFPSDFAFQLSSEECAHLRSQSATSTAGHGGRRSLPFAYTEHGALMVASILNSRQAIEMGVFIVRAFVRLRSVYASHAELTRRLDELDAKVSRHDAELRAILDAIRRLALPQGPRSRPIGFAPTDHPPV